MGIGHAVVQHAASTSDWIASASVVVALLPRRFDDAKWSGPGGEEIPGQSGPAVAPELVGSGGGRAAIELPQQGLLRVIARDPLCDDLLERLETADIAPWPQLAAALIEVRARSA